MNQHFLLLFTTLISAVHFENEIKAVPSIFSPGNIRETEPKNCRPNPNFHDQILHFDDDRVTLFDSPHSPSPMPKALMCLALPLPWKSCTNCTRTRPQSSLYIALNQITAVWIERHRKALRFVSWELSTIVDGFREIKRRSFEWLWPLKTNGGCCKLLLQKWKYWGAYIENSQITIHPEFSELQISRGDRRF